MTDIQPPAGYQIPPSLAPTPAPATTSPVIGKRTAPAPGKSLIDRYGLSARIPSVDKGKGKEKAEDESETPTGQPGQGQGVGKWEGSKEERERGLRERKEKMVLEARR
jgi:coupling of ubiquitin conjugation to ER degradation protein 1